MIKKCISDGKGGMYIGGVFSTVGGITKQNVAHINADYSVDRIFDFPTNNLVTDMLLIGDTLFIGGQFTYVASKYMIGLAAINVKTNEILNWNAGGLNVNCLLQIKNKLYAGYQTGLVEIDLSSGIATPLPVVGDVRYLTSIGDTLYLSGGFSQAAGQNRQGMAAFDITTKTLTDFNPPTSYPNQAYPIYAYKNRIYTCGYYNDINSQKRTGITSLDPITGNLQSFYIPYNYSCFDMIGMGDSLYIAGKLVDSYSSKIYNAVACINLTNSTIAKVVSTNDEVYTVNIINNKIFAGGKFSSIGGELRNYVGSIDLTNFSITPFQVKINSSPISMAATETELYIGGLFSSVNDQPRTNFAAVNIFTGDLLPFKLDPDAPILDMYLDTNSLWLSGGFKTVAGQTRNYIAEVDLTTQTLTSWQNNVLTWSPSKLIVNESNLFIAGGYNGTNGYTMEILSIDKPTGTSIAWRYPSTPVYDMFLAGDTLIIGGVFDSIAGQPRISIAALNTSTGNLLDWAPVISGAGYHSPFVSSIFGTDSIIYIGGAMNVSNKLSYAAAIERKSGNVNPSWVVYLDDNPSTLLAYRNYIFLGGSFTRNNSLLQTGENAMGVSAYEYQNRLPGYKYSLKGKIVENSSCSLQNANALSNWIVVASPGPYYTTSNANGDFTITADSGTYNVKQVIPADRSRIVDVICPSSPYTVAVNDNTQGASGLNFINSVKDCPFLRVEIKSLRRRRCYPSTTIVSYCNEGKATATNVEVKVVYPAYVRALSSSIPWTIKQDSIITFAIDNLLPGACGAISIRDSVLCETEDITGLTQCTKAFISPQNDCLPYSPLWDKADLHTYAICEDNGYTRLKIANEGVGNMNDSVQYRIFFDTKLVFLKNLKLRSKDSLILNVPAHGQTIRLEADQVPYNPYNSIVILSVEACGSSVSSASKGFMMQQNQDNMEDESAISCLEITDSFDPNDKQVVPVGRTSYHFIKDTDELNYQIRFQNTGSDTAFKVVIIDTLSQNLDIASINGEIATHPFTWDLSGKGKPVITWTFQDIDLPPNTSNEEKSQGFISFNLKQVPGNIEGTVISNKAYIYFDFNNPIVTNETKNIVNNSIDSDFSIGNGITIEPTNLVNSINDPNKTFPVSVYPNPFKETSVIYLDNNYGKISLILFDINGKIRRTEEFIGTKFELDRKELPQGIYFFKIETEDKEVVMGKIMIN